MSLQLIGLNHKTAPLEIREKLAFKEQSCVSELRNLADGARVCEALILSTCNRVEILLEGEQQEAAFEHTVEFLAASRGIGPQFFAEHLYHYSDERAIRHLFRVASSLDSMIIGEPQILGQVRKAYSLATEAGTAGRKIHKLLHHTFRTAKRVRSETRIGSLAVSVSFAAVEKARKIFGSLAGKTVLLIGAGEMAELAAKHLLNKGASRILICNRTRRSALNLATGIGGEAVDFENLETILPQADVVICSTAAPDFLISAEMALRSQNARELRPTLFIDICVPRNISPGVGEIKNVFLYDVDNLQSAVSANSETRRREAALAERIINEEVAAFWEYLPALERGKTIDMLRQKMRDAARTEFERNRPRLGDLKPEQEAAIEQLLMSTVNKISRPVLYGLQRSHEAGEFEFAEILCTMLGENEIQPVVFSSSSSSSSGQG